MKYFIACILTVSIISGLILVFSENKVLAADTFKQGLQKTSEKIGYNPVENGRDAMVKTAGKILNIILGFIGVLFLLLMIHGGDVWMNARGNEQQIAKAKTILTNAFFGIVAILVAYAITFWVGRYLLTGQLE